jgi:hypothetical protein
MDDVISEWDVAQAACRALQRHCQYFSATPEVLAEVKWKTPEDREYWMEIARVVLEG